MRRSILVALPLALLGISAAPPRLPAGTADSGLAALDQALRDLASDNTVLYLAAQPEGVDAETLACLRLRKGARVIVVLAGWEEGCGRMDECAGLADNAAPRVARLHQAADELGWEIRSLGMPATGFDPERAARRLVRVIRETLPDTILTHHTNNQRCGFGRGIRASAEEAFRLAPREDAFPGQFEDGLLPWQPLRLCERTRCPSNPTWEFDAAVPLDEFEPIRGRTCADIAAAWPFRGQCREAGENAAYYRVVLSAPGVESVDGLLPPRSAAATLAESFSAAAPRRAVRAWSRAVQSAAQSPLGERDRILRYLDDAAAALDELARLASEQPEAAVSAPRLGASVETLRVELNRAAAAALGLRTRILRAPPQVCPGAEFEVVTETRYHWEGPLYHLRVYPDLPDGIALLSLQADQAYLATSHADSISAGTAAPTVSAARFDRGQNLTVAFRFRVSESVVPEEWPLQPDAAFPRGLFPVVTEFSLSRTGETIQRLESPLPSRMAPVIDIEVVPESPLFLLRPDREVMVQVRVTNRADRPWPRSLVALRPPDGFTISRQELPRVTLLPSETASVAYWVRPEQIEPGVHLFRGMVIHGLEEGQTYRDVDPRQLGTALAELPLTFARIEVPSDVTVGLVRTCGHVLESALESLDIPFRVLEADEIAAADLGRWDVLLIDAGAYSQRPDLVRHYKRLLRYIWRGGHVIVMGNDPAAWEPKYAPYPLELAAQPVPPEGSAVEFLAAGHPLLAAPNPLEPADFDGWRGPWGRYFVRSRDEAYTPLLSVEGAAGGYLVGAYGYGSYVYTGFDWEPQLANAHVGAYRALANMIAYPRHRKTPGEPGNAGSGGQ